MNITDVPEAWQVVGTKEHFKGRIVTVLSDDVLMPDGDGGTVTVNREYVLHPGAVGAIALDERGRVLLIRQYRHPVKHLLWELPAGLRDVEGEPLWRTASRELMEEAGYRAATWHTLVDTFQTPGMSDERVRVFLARDLEKIPDEEIDFVREHEEADLRIEWVPLEEAVEKVLSGEIHNALAVTGILAAHAASATGFKHLRDKEAAEAPLPA
jgi:8-oxo-dGTP pyrophosphatase MutT (NUDIX family)